MDVITLGERVYQTLREKILQGEYKPGRKFNVDQIARDLQVSKTPVREAMTRLERLGLVENVPYCGPKIKHLNKSQLTDLYEVRINLEELAVKLAMQREDPDVFENLEGILREYEQAVHEGDTREVLTADRAFHDALVQASGNSILLEMLPGLSDRTQMLLELFRPPDEALDETTTLHGFHDHRHLYELLVAGDMEGAIQELHGQLTRAREELMARMDKHELAIENG